MTVSRNFGTETCRRRLHGLMLVIAILVQGCAAQGPDASAASGAAVDPRATDLPAGAIPVSRDLYQIPIGTDEDGCPMFRLYSPTRMVAQVIYYRDVAGGFTMNKQDTACVNPMAD